MNWIEINIDEYNEIFGRQEMKPFSSFTDTEGCSPFGYGCPAFDTEWGPRSSEFPTLRHEARKPSGYGNWESKFYKSV